MKFCLYLFMFALVAAQLEVPVDETVLPSERTKASKTSYSILYVCCGAIMLWLVVDLWVIMSDKKKDDLPYYLEPTDSMKNEEKKRKENEKNLIK